MYDIREWVGRQPNQTRRMRSRLIGRNGRIRSLIEEISRCEMAIYGSSVLVIGDEDGLDLAAPAIEGILQGSEHSTVLHGLEQDRKRQRLRSRRLESHEERRSDEGIDVRDSSPGTRRGPQAQGTPPPELTGRPGRRGTGQQHAGTGGRRGSRLRGRVTYTAMHKRENSSRSVVMNPLDELYDYEEWATKALLLVTGLPLRGNGAESA
ncbi:MAG: hypothetical protein Ct9H300mP10_06780 [Methanobacteriota archaeon]|nr:MAG: hypothetical protein Ct9H300mP10_06780 [Euryarchaeota archaeon]